MSGGGAFEHRHVVGFEETNLVGNAYYVNHLRWQAVCREQFLESHAPAVLRRLADDLSFVTTRCSCEYVVELAAFDEVVIRMHLVAIEENRVALRFDYVRVRADAGEELVARGEEEIACVRRENGRAVPADVPTELRDALAAL